MNVDSLCLIEISRVNELLDNGTHAFQPGLIIYFDMADPFENIFCHLFNLSCVIIIQTLWHSIHGDQELLIFVKWVISGNLPVNV